MVYKFTSHIYKFSVYSPAYIKSDVEGLIEKFKLLISFCPTSINFMYLNSWEKKNTRFHKTDTTSEIEVT